MTFLVTVVLEKVSPASESLIANPVSRVSIVLPVMVVSFQVSSVVHGAAEPPYSPHPGRYIEPMMIPNC